MHSFEQNFAFRPISGNKKFQHTQVCKVTERTIIVFRIAQFAPLVGNVD
jgi:hypothetical protein